MSVTLRKTTDRPAYAMPEGTRAALDAYVGAILDTLAEVDATEAHTSSECDAWCRSGLTSCPSVWEAEQREARQVAERARQTETAWDRAFSEGWGWDVLADL